jgi:hypothetical protein
LQFSILNLQSPDLILIFCQAERGLHRTLIMLFVPTDLRILLAVGMACAAVCGCGSRAQNGDRPLVVVVSGDTAGWIVPCGCASNQSGGLPRRATYVESLRAQADVVLADAGGAACGPSPYDRAKFAAILRGEVAMGVAAHNLGASEVALGPEHLARLAQETGVPFVSANVRDAEGRPLAEPLRIVEAAGRRVALIGVLSPKYATPQIRVGPPRQAVLATLARAAARCDAVVVLAYLPPAELRGLAEMLPEVDAVVGGPTRQPLVPEQVGPVLLVSATNQGKFLARLDAPLPGAAGRWTGAIVELDEQYADDPGQLANLRALYEELGRADFTPADTSFAVLVAAPSEGFQIAGTDACRKCHQHKSDCKIWKASGHAKAWESIRRKGAHVDPDCQRCHTTGYGLPGGFESVRRSGERVDVGCECCHGPSAAHVADEKVHTAFYARAKDHCTGCHDRENSPKFEYEQYWEKIRHGKGELQIENCKLQIAN